MEFIFAVVVGIAGMLWHFWKRKIKNQTLVGLKTYIFNHVGYTVMALTATIVGAIPLSAMVDFSNPAGLATAATAIFGVGYMCDSGINKVVEGSTVP